MQFYGQNLLLWQNQMFSAKKYPFLTVCVLNAYGSKILCRFGHKLFKNCHFDQVFVRFLP